MQLPPVGLIDVLISRNANNSKTEARTGTGFASIFSGRRNVLKCPLIFPGAGYLVSHLGKIEKLGMSELSIVQSVPLKARRDDEVRIRWEDLTKPEQRLYLQAEKEFRIGTVSPKVLTDAREQSQSEAEIEGLYVRLRYEELRQQRAEQQRKIAERQAQQKISRLPEGGGGKRDSTRKVSKTLRKVCFWILALFFGLAVVGATFAGIWVLLG